MEEWLEHEWGEIVRIGEPDSERRSRSELNSPVALGWLLFLGSRCFFFVAVIGPRPGRALERGRRRRWPRGGGGCKPHVISP